MKLSLRDRAFGHSPFSNNPATPVSFSRHMTWDRETPVSDKTIYTDAEIFNAPDGAIAWLLEPIFERPDAYEFLLEKGPRLKEIWTSDRRLMGLLPNTRFVPFGGCWIAPDDRKVWPKSRDVSIIASVKRGSKAYDMRHAVAALPGVDAFGYEYTRLENKIDGLRDHRFQVVIENVRCDFWFTEKLIDCFATGTVPIYRGCPSIGDFFNTEGMIIIDDASDVADALSVCAPHLYEVMLPAIRDNFERAKKYYLAEDWLCENEPELMKSLAL